MFEGGKRPCDTSVCLSSFVVKKAYLSLQMRWAFKSETAF